MVLRKCHRGHFYLYIKAKGGGSSVAEGQTKLESEAKTLVPLFYILKL